MRFIKKSSRGLEARIQTYTNADGRTITTAGAMHAATQESWDYMNTYLTNATNNGAVVHLEGVQPAEATNEAEQRGINAIRAMIALGNQVSKLTGLVYQKEALIDNPKWEIHDTTILDIVHGMDSKVLGFIEGIPLNSIKISPKRAVWSLRNISRIQFIGQFIPMVRRLLGALINNRNVFAVNAAVSANKDVVMFWGAAHLPGMHKLIKAAGFKPTHTEWRLVIPNSYRVANESQSAELVTSNA